MFLLILWRITKQISLAAMFLQVNHWKQQRNSWQWLTYVINGWKRFSAKKFRNFVRYSYFHYHHSTLRVEITATRFFVRLVIHWLVIESTAQQIRNTPSCRCTGNPKRTICYLRYCLRTPVTCSYAENVKIADFYVPDATEWRNAASRNRIFEDLGRTDKSPPASSKQHSRFSQCSMHELVQPADNHGNLIWAFSCNAKYFTFLTFHTCDKSLPSSMRCRFMIDSGRIVWRA